MKVKHRFQYYLILHREYPAHKFACPRVDLPRPNTLAEEAGWTEYPPTEAWDFHANLL